MPVTKTKMNEVMTARMEQDMFDPPRGFQAEAGIKSFAQYREMYEFSVKDPEGFWAKQAEIVDWMKPFDRVFDGSLAEGSHKWYAGGKLNVSANCIDRHLATWRKNKAAILWQGERENEARVLTYNDLYNEVCRFANVLKKYGVKKGDRVAVYLPMIPEISVAMLACARIGAVHNVVFAGFGAESLRDRINDSGAKVLVTADAGLRKGAPVPLKANADLALAGCPGVETCIVVRHASVPVEFRAHRDKWWHEEMEAPDITPACPPEEMDAEDPLFILYTSGSTGKPKGVVHSGGGYLVYAALTTKYVFDMKEDDTFWCTADAGWITGHSYGLYGPLALGVTTVMFEGLPNFPAPDRYWQAVEKYRVTVFYTAPTVIRSLMKEGDEWVYMHDLSSLRLLGSVGEVMNPKAWMWYYTVVGKEQCPIVDTYWQTETGGILIAPLPGAVPAKPGSAAVPFFGVRPAVVNGEGTECGENKDGILTVRGAWPGLMKDIHNQPGRFKETYLSAFPGAYFTGDGARVDEDGYFWLLGRVDDVLNVSGHRLGTAEIENAIVSHPAVAEATVVGYPHDIKGEGIYAYILLKNGAEAGDGLKDQIRKTVRGTVGPIAVPDKIQFVAELPKTRSGKILRRILRKISSGEFTHLGDVTTLADPGVLTELIRMMEA